jgi:hypothetical protein
MSEPYGAHVHHAGDGRGRRLVILDGSELNHVIWCDTLAGVAVVADQPLHSSDGETVDIHPVWGKIIVRPIE